MDKKTNFFISVILAILLLIVALICILIFVDLKNNIDYLNLAQSLSVYAMAFLSIGLCYENNKTKFPKSLLFIGKLCLLAFIICIIVIFLISNGQFFIPIIMALLALGLFFTNRACNMTFSPEEFKDIMNATAFFWTPLGKFVIFFICLAIAATLWAGFPYIRNIFM